MRSPTIRDMVEADIVPAAEMVLRNEWRARPEWFAFAVAQPRGVPVLAELDGEIVGTGVGTASGPAGWIGTIFVAPELRGHGLGRALTQAVIDRLGAAGCTTLVLVATTEGRRLYERMGFEVEARYRIFEADGLAGDGPAAGVGAVHVRAFGGADLDPIAALDREATGEDRREALVRFADPASAKVALGPAGELDGFVVRAPWGGGATVARTLGTALAILEARRRAAGPDGRTRVGLLDSNAIGLEAVARLGLEEMWSAPRMVRGDPLDWRPDWIWGQFNHAMG